MSERCAGREGSCPVLKMIQAAAKHADEQAAKIAAREAAGEAFKLTDFLVPVGAKEMVNLVTTLQKDFAGYRCAVGNVLTTGNLPLLGFLCLGTEDGSCLRILLNPDDVGKLIRALEGIRMMMAAGAAVAPGQVQ